MVPCIPIDGLSVLEWATPYQGWPFRSVETV